MKFSIVSFKVQSGIILGITIRLIAGSFDASRIEDHIQAQGGTLLHKSWAPFGPGWLGEKNARIYKISYRDNKNRIHSPHVKTSMWSGVSLTDDRIIGGTPTFDRGRKSSFKKMLSRTRK